jgi:hypothetical protein
MESLFEKLISLSEHFILLEKTFKQKENYNSSIDYDIFLQNNKRLKKIISHDKLKYYNQKAANGKSIKIPTSFVNEIYGEDGRQMKLADIIEFMLYSRGVFYLFQSNRFQTERVCSFLEINLRLVNLLMVFETLTVDKKLRDTLLANLKPLIGEEQGYDKILNWEHEVGLNKEHPKYSIEAPNDYFDTLLPKTAGGLWHEILVYCFILKYNIGYIFPLLLTQKPISLKHKLSPPDLIILHNKTFRYYGIEIGALKERQSGGFMAPSGIPVIPIDTLNARISDRCPTCSKWIGICPKVIKDFSNTVSNTTHLVNEIRCLTECNIYTLEQQLNGECKYMKFKYKTNKWKFSFTKGHHHHYHCCLQEAPILKYKIKQIQHLEELKRLSELRSSKMLNGQEVTEMNALQKRLRPKYSFIKTHSVFYSELTTLYKMSSNDSVVIDTEEDEEN